MSKYYSTTETAQLIRRALRESFPGVKFSVRSDKYAGGSSIRVSWTDGPTQHSVDAIASGFSGSGFDGMQDLKYFKDNTLNGETVRFVVDFIFCRRDTSTEFEAKCLAAWRMMSVEDQTELLNNAPVHYTFTSWNARNNGFAAMADDEIGRWVAANVGPAAQRASIVATASSARHYS